MSKIIIMEAWYVKKTKQNKTAVNVCSLIHLTQSAAAGSRNSVTRASLWIYFY